MFPLKNFIAFTKNKYSISSNYQNDDIEYLERVRSILEKDEYFVDLKVTGENFESMVNVISQFLLTKIEKHINSNNISAFLLSNVIRETREVNAWKYCNYFTKNSPTGENENIYNMDIAIICYCISNLRWTTPEDLGWDNWDKII